MFHNIQTRWLLPLSFFIFISYIIFLADTANYNFAFRTIGHIPYGDKIMHALLYGMMAGLLNWGLRYRRCCRYGVFVPYLGSMAVLFFAAAEEVTQYWIPSRTFDLGDLAADLLGVLLVSFLFPRQ